MCVCVCVCVCVCSCDTLKKKIDFMKLISWNTGKLVQESEIKWHRSNLLICLYLEINSHFFSAI